MHASPTPSATHRRLARLETWARLWLVWFGGRLIAWFGVFAPIPRQRARVLHGWLDQIAKLVACVILMRAHATLPRNSCVRRRKHGRPPAHAAQSDDANLFDLRALIGAELRQMLKHGTLGERLQTLMHVLTHMDPLIARIAKRLRRGLTRRQPIRPRRSTARVVLRDITPAIASADSS